MPKDIVVQVRQANVILRTLASAAWPDALGDRKFSEPIRASINKEMRAAFRKIKAVSPILKEENLLLAGPRDCYENRSAMSEKPRERRAEDEGGDYRLVDKTREMILTLTPDARNGLARALLLLTHPASKWIATIAIQEEIVYPMAEVVGCMRMIAEETGENKNEIVKIAFDEDAADEKDAKKEPHLVP